jgi:uroporphyrinogen decarboxylase
MNSLERFNATMNYGPRDRAPFRELMWPASPETAERWAREGGYLAETTDIHRYLGGQTDFGCDRWVVECSWFFPAPPFEHTIVAEDEETVTYVDPMGIVLRELKEAPMSSMPQFIRFPVQTREDFRKYWKERMRPDLTERLGSDWQEQLRRHRNRDSPLVVIADKWGGFFGQLRNLVGVERLCVLFYDDPSFLEEMMDADAEFQIAVLSRMLEETDIDVYAFWEDMAYKTAPLISPELVRKFMLPRYKKVIDFGRSRGVHFFALDSDGNVDSLIPVWMDAGIDILYPFEVQAGMDVVALRKKYGRALRMWGGVDKRPLAEGPAAIDRELQRVAPLIQDGGFVPMLDHLATPDISYKNYCYFLDQLRKIL